MKNSYITFFSQINRSKMIQLQSYFSLFNTEESQFLIIFMISMLFELI